VTGSDAARVVVCAGGLGTRTASCGVIAAMSYHGQVLMRELTERKPDWPRPEN
jgi:hypothetical protein